MIDNKSPSAVYVIIHKLLYSDIWTNGKMGDQLLPWRW